MKYPKRVKGAGIIDKLYKNKNKYQYQNGPRDFPADSPYLPALAEELRTARRNLSDAYGEFNQATEPILIEACVYRIRAETARCDYLLRAVKASGNLFVAAERGVSPEAIPAPESVSGAAAIESVPDSVSGTAAAIESVPGGASGTAAAIESVPGNASGTAAAIGPAPGIFPDPAAVPAFAPDMAINHTNNDERGVKSS